MTTLAWSACLPPAESAPQAPDVAVASCSDPPVHELEDTIETEGDFDAALAALDLDALPDDIDTGALGATAHDMVAYMLEQPPLGFTHFAKADARGTLLGDVVLGAFATSSAAGDAGGADIPFLRRGLFARYACARGQEIQLDDFRAAFHIDASFGADLGVGDVGAGEVGAGDASVEVISSLPKHGPRRLLHFVDADADIFLAQTLLDDGAGGTAVRETEAIVHGLRSDGALDFYAWDAHGDLERSSLFATSSGGAAPGPVPFACMTCHRDADGGTGYTVVRP